MKAKLSILTSALFSSLGVGLFVGLLTASSASAEVPVFEQLRGLFETGTQATDIDLIGWRSGRCYHADQPAIPWNGLLVGWQTQGPDHGPISTGGKILRTLPVYWANGAPGIFDDPSPQVQQSVERFLAGEAPMVAPAQYDERTTYGSYTNRFEHQWAIRKGAAGGMNGNVMNKLIDDPKAPNEGPNKEPNKDPKEPNKDPKAEPEPPPPPQEFLVARMTRSGVTIQYCYYFKLVR